MKKLRRIQNINNAVMLFSFIGACAMILAMQPLIFVGFCIALFCCFKAEKDIEKARRAFLSSGRKMDFPLTRRQP